MSSDVYAIPASDFPRGADFIPGGLCPEGPGDHGDIN